jgi:hypothetical protein
VARFWKEIYDGRRYGDTPMELPPAYAKGLVKQELICVNVCSFTFKFATKDEIQEYIEFFGRKTHPTSRVPEQMLAKCSFGHWHSQRWYEKLPLYLQENPKREQVLKALKKAVTLVDAGKL